MLRAASAACLGGGGGGGGGGLGRLLLCTGELGAQPRFVGLQRLVVTPEPLGLLLRRSRRVFRSGPAASRT
eukprot:COSAG04_NODE_1537_length_6425_cov_2.244546_3_plen_71_part_00